MKDVRPLKTITFCFVQPLACSVDACDCDYASAGFSSAAASAEQPQRGSSISTSAAAAASAGAALAGAAASPPRLVQLCGCSLVESQPAGAASDAAFRRPRIRAISAFAASRSAISLASAAASPLRH